MKIKREHLNFLGSIVGVFGGNHIPERGAASCILMKHLDLFSGIGGFALAAERVWGKEYRNVGFCDNDPFCQAVLKKHWPKSTIYGDIRTLTNPKRARELQPKRSKQEERKRISYCDLVTGGFPCQPFSIAGRKNGTKDDRYLWPEMLRVIQEFNPRYVVAENVLGLLSNDGGMVFERVCLDLENEGYEVQPVIIPACSLGAPHRRNRIWIVAHSDKIGLGRGAGQIKREGIQTEQDREDIRPEDEGCAWIENWPQAATRLCAVDDGIRSDVVRPSGWRYKTLAAAGNAIVPQIAEQIFKAIKEVGR